MTNETCTVTATTDVQLALVNMVFGKTTASYFCCLSCPGLQYYPSNQTNTPHFCCPLPLGLQYYLQSNLGVLFTDTFLLH